MAPSVALPLLARNDELAALDALLHDVDQLRTPVAVIRGEAGIGKSYLLQAFLERVRRRGGAVLFGRADPGELSLPYAALVHALGSLPAQPPDVQELLDAVRSEMDAAVDVASADLEERGGRVLSAMTRLLS